MTTSPLADARVRSAAELTDRWRSVLHPATFPARSLWLTWFDTDGRQLPVVVPVDDLPALPEPALLVGVREVHGSVVDDQLGGAGHLALALCRPGEPVVTAEDETWAAELRSTLDDGAVAGTWSLHLAAAGSVLPLVDRSGR
ncbi:hypothetical protein [Blastococcus sp. KM273129]|uniref:hypothetical protein n=1 Tax=Blastococcus sp. KM273129 TaxID=2570315 RepID=UPI001F30076E|nr:hypothetical protein [Blastococcus sp. KM273129]MCF6737200.1 hypothetical protein [Blastococcus sp. KM273129]